MGTGSGKRCVLEGSHPRGGYLCRTRNHPNVGPLSQARFNLSLDYSLAPNLRLCGRDSGLAGSPAALGLPAVAPAVGNSFPTVFFLPLPVAFLLAAFARKRAAWVVVCIPALLWLALFGWRYLPRSLQVEAALPRRGGDGVQYPGDQPGC